MRIVGDSKFYTFHLKQSNGRYSQDFTISLPSVTSIISRTFAAPALQRWNYSQTRDSIAGLAAVTKGFDAENSLSLIEMIEDGDILEEWLALNKMRPEDISREAMERGSREHETLEGLARTALDKDHEEAAQQAGKLLQNGASSPWARATADWWLTRLPTVIASEQVVYQLEPFGGYAGSLDLVYEVATNRKIPGELNRWETKRVLTDLKSRKEGAGVYDSDEIQVAAYELAWTQNTGKPVDEKTILVVREDGTWVEEEATVPAKVFLNLLEVARILDRR
jgi:hypothetical protein